MTMRDDFPEEVKRVVAQRAAYLCSRPDCCRLTIGPHSDPGKSTNMGVAAHICAASPGGPRFDATQGERERKSINNAIWLCHACGDLVDRDVERFTKAILADWKVKHESLVSNEGGYPSIPLVSLNTQIGMTLPSSGTFTLTAQDVERYKEHHLEIRQDTGRMFHYLFLRIQFPEPVVGFTVAERPLGSIVECSPDRPQFVGHASGSGSVTVNAMDDRPAYDFKFSMDRLPSGQKVLVRFISERDDPDPDFDRILEAHMPGMLQHHVIGSWQYEMLGQYLTREFFVALPFDSRTREIHSATCLDYEEARAQMKLAGASIVVRQTF